MDGETRRSVWMLGTCGEVTPRDAENYRRFGIWTLVWAACFLGATFFLRTGAVSGPAGWVVAAATTLVGVGAVWAYVRLVRDADELVQRIHLEALAWGFGVGALFMMGYRLFERAGAPELDLGDPLVVMCFVWAFAQWAVARRYR